MDLPADPLAAQFLLVARGLARSSRRRQRLMLAGAAVALLGLALVTTLGMLAYRERSEEAVAARQEMEQRALILESGRAMESSSREALRLAVQAATVLDSAASRTALRAALDRPWIDRLGIGHNGMISWMQVDPRGRVWTAGMDGTVRFWEADLGSIWSQSVGEPVLQAQLVEGGERVVALGAQGGVYLAERGLPLRQLWKADRALPIFSASEGARYLAVATPSEIVRIDTRDGSVRHYTPGASLVAISPDGQRLVAGRHQEGFDIWSAEGQLLRRIRPEGMGQAGVVVAPDGRSFYSHLDRDGKILRWDMEGRPLARLSGHSHFVTLLQFFGHSRTLLTGAYDRTARLWVDDQPHATLSGHGGRVVHADYSWEGEFIATASDDASVMIWQHEGLPVAQLRGHLGWINAVKWAPQGEHIYTAGQDGHVRRWALDPSTLAVMMDTRNEHRLGRFDPNLICEPRSALEQKARPIFAHTGIIEIRSAATSRRPDQLLRNGSAALVISGDRYARLWDLSKQGLPISVEHGEEYIIGGVAVEGGFLTWTSRSAARWGLRGEPLGRVDLELLSGLGGPGGVVWLGEAGGGLWRWPPEGEPALVAQLEYPITALAWDGQGNLMVGGGDGEVERWSREGLWLQSMQRGEGPVLALGALGAQTWVDSQGEARLLDPDGRERLRADGAGLRLLVAPHPTAPVVLVGEPDGRAALWSADRAEALPLLGHRGAMRQVAWSPDGRLLLTSNNDGVPHLWDLQGQLLAELREEKQVLWSAIFTPDGQEIITSATGQLRRWDLQGQPKEVLRSYDISHWSMQLSWSPDGRLWVWLDDAAVDQVDISPESALEEAHRRLESVPDIEPTRGLPGLYGSLN